MSNKQIFRDMKNLKPKYKIGRKVYVVVTDNIYWDAFDSESLLSCSPFVAVGTVDGWEIEVSVNDEGNMSITESCGLEEFFGEWNINSVYPTETKALDALEDERKTNDV